MNGDFVRQLIEATEEVFSTMVFLALESEQPIEGDSVSPNGHVVGSVGFAGSECGLVSFYSSLEAAREIAASMLGMSPDDVNGELPDAIGEITNMIAGSFRTRMATDGDAWAISIPTVTVGSDFQIKPMTAGRRVLVPFRMNGRDDLFVELIVTPRPAE